MWSLSILVAFALWLGTTLGQTNSTSSGGSSADLDFGPVVFGGYNNYVYRDNTTSAQVVITQGSNASSPTRFITAFPNGNTGTLIYFVPLSSSNGTGSSGNGSSNGTAALGATLVNGTLGSYSGANNQTGITGQMSISADLKFGVTIIGSVRTMRDYTESGGTVFHPIFNYTLGAYNSTSVQLVRNWINGTTVQYLTFDVVSNGNFTVVPNSNASIPADITLTRPSASSNATVRFTTSFNFTGTTPSTPFVPLEGLGRQDLFLTSIPISVQGEVDANTTTNLARTLSSIQTNATAVADQLAFLAYSDKFLAGGWRFLTYFGRDTMLALRLLLPVVSTTTAEAILGAVIERTNDTGTLCHEETIGDYASFINIQNNQSSLGNEPSYSYVMVDTDFLLLPVLADYFLTTPQGTGRSAVFLARNSALKNGTYAQLLQKNVDHVLNLSRPFAEDPSASNLVRIRDATVGNWRDSNAGLGYGKFAFDVNAALVPAALRAIAQLAQGGLLPGNYTSVATVYATTWESQASQYFAFNVSSGNATTYLNSYVQAANLSTALVYGAGSLNGTAGNGTSGGGNSTNSTGAASSMNLAWSAVNQTVGGNSSTAVYGVSLSENGSVVEIQNSDLGFVLTYANNVPRGIIQATIEALQPYPRGLLTNVGMVVANAAYDSNRTNIEVFSNLAYHGAVSWSWQQGLMASGISRQLGLCSLSPSTQLEPLPTNYTRPSWCSDTALTTALTQAQYRLWDSIAGSAPALYTEVLSPVWSNSTGNFSIGDLGALSPEGTEGDAIQLWSYGFLGLVDPRTGRAVAAGFP